MPQRHDKTRILLAVS